MQKIARQKLITCILPKGRATRVLARLKHEKGIIAANVNFARGAGRLTPLAYRGVGETTEKELLNVVVAADRANEIFDYIYHEAEIDRPHGGLIFQQALRFATPFRLPDLPEED